MDVADLPGPQPVPRDSLSVNAGLRLARVAVAVASRFRRVTLFGE